MIINNHRVKIIYLIEFLERVAYYIFLSSFVFLMTQENGMDQESAFSLYGTMMSLFYATPILGGILADRKIGYYKAVVLGSCGLFVGYALLAGLPGKTLFFALAALSIGHGLYKPGLMAVFANSLAAEGRDTAFVIFFGVINLAGGLAGGTASWLSARGGPTLVFASSASCLALATGLALALLRTERAGEAERSALPEASATPAAPAVHGAAVPWGLILQILLITALSQAATVQTQIERVLWSRSHADLTFGGLWTPEMGRALLQASDGIFQILLLPCVVLLFNYLRRRSIEPSSVAKVGMALVLQLLPCFLLFRAAQVGSQGQLAGTGWIVGATLAAALPSLFLIPLVLSMISRLIPRDRQATLFALWFLLVPVFNGINSRILKWSVAGPSEWRFLPAATFALIAAVWWIANSRKTEQALAQTA